MHELKSNSVCICISQRKKINFASLLLLSLQRNQVQSGSALKRSPPTPGRRACHLEWGCQGSGLGTPSLSGSRWPCSCKWQLRSPSTVQVRAYHGAHVLCGRAADKERGMGGSFICWQFLCVWESNRGGLKEREAEAWCWLFLFIFWKLNAYPVISLSHLSHTLPMDRTGCLILI